MCLVSADTMILKMDCQKDCYHVQNDRSIYPIILEGCAPIWLFFITYVSKPTAMSLRDAIVRKMVG